MGSGPSGPQPSSMGTPATFETHRPTFRASGPCCVFRVPIWEINNDPCHPKVLKVAPKVTPKWGQSQSNSDGWTLQNMWYLWCGSQFGPLWEESEITLGFACFPGAYFSGVVVTFVDFGFKMVLKMRAFLVPDYITKKLFLDGAPTSG